MTERTVFFISDGTGITAESFGQSLLTQFSSVNFAHETLPYVDTPEKAYRVVERINTIAQQGGTLPLIFSTIVNEAIRQIIATSEGMMQDIFASYIGALEAELHAHSSHEVGKKRAIDNSTQYSNRMDAVHFALLNDDGVHTRHYDSADVILVGVSRSGKTPTCLYMALQFGIRAANYPITEEDLTSRGLPNQLLTHHDKLFGLTIEPKRLADIRQKRRPDSRYSSLEQCFYEVQEVENRLQRANIPYINTTHHSIEEIATRLIAQTGIERRLK